MALSISTDGTAGPYIIVPEKQLDAVCASLNRKRIPYAVDYNAIRVKGKTNHAVVNLGQGIDDSDVRRVQSILASLFAPAEPAPKGASPKKAGRRN